MIVVHYANDSTVYMIEDSFDSLKHKTNFELGKLDNRFFGNTFSLIISKSQFCLCSNIHHNNSSAMQIRGQVLTQCSHTKFLGIVGDDKL